MDKRIALNKGAELDFKNDNSFCYVIDSELARGGSCIVYNAHYTNNLGTNRSVRIKECYPFKLNIDRDKNNNLIVSEGEKNDYEKVLNRTRDAFNLCNNIFNQVGLTNSTTNTIDIYENNNTYYIVSTFQEGKTLSLNSFNNLKDYVSIVLSVAKTIKKIHDMGYLYLDIKPDNVFIFDETTDLIQLFDFDSIIPIGEYKNNETRISFTKGFTAIEQQMQQYKKISKSTDIYGLGALLFYLLFGRTPSVKDCIDSASYEFQTMRFENRIYQNGLYRELTEFFHNALANYYLDRYQDMGEAVSKLEVIRKLSNVSSPFIQSSKVYKKNNFVGREEEMKYLDGWMKRTKDNCLFVYGMGGIGKSTIVRNFIYDRYEQFDNIMYLSFSGSIERTIIDDSKFRINGIKKDEKESNEEYFHRKVDLIKDITKKSNSIIIIDNFVGDITKNLISLLDCDCKFIVVSRKKPATTNFEIMCIKEMDDRATLYNLFDKYSNISIDDNKKYLDNILLKTRRHTLTLELLAKQISTSRLSLEKASNLLDMYGFGNISSSKVDYEKDYTTSKNTITEIIQELFLYTDPSVEKKSILKSLALFDEYGIDADLFMAMTNTKSESNINELINDGWVELNNNTLSLHPVISGMINSWEWNDYSLEKVNKLMEFLFIEIKVHGKKEEYPKKLHERNKKIYELMNKNVRFKTYISKRMKNQGVTGKAYFERVQDTIKSDEYDEFLSDFLKISKQIIKRIGNVDMLRDNDFYKNLLYGTVINLPRSDENFVLNRSYELLSYSGISNSYAKMNLYEKIINIYDERKEYNNAFKELNNAKKLIRLSMRLRSQYYFMAADYYDSKLDGDYYDDKSLILDDFMKSIDKAIKYSKYSKHPDCEQLLTKCILSKVNILIRNGSENTKEVGMLLAEAKVHCESSSQSYSINRVYYNMSCAWFFTYMVENMESALEFVNDAYEISHKINSNELDLIDNVIVPHANILFEFDKPNEAINILKEGVGICNQNHDIRPYIVKNEELNSHLLEIYVELNDSNKIKETEIVIKELHERLKYM